jgi:Uma2 family endonuclease
MSTIIAPAPKHVSTKSQLHWEPVWEIAHLFPEQGEWTVEEYFDLDTNWLVEFTDGVLEVLHTADEPQPPEELVAAYPNLTWEIAYLFPGQGQWSVGEYMALRPRRQVEFTDGFIEVLPMPKQSHQLVLDYLYQALRIFVLARQLGRILFSPLRVQVRPDKFREPDLVFMKTENLARCQEEAWLGADLVMKIVSEDSKSRKRDLERKRADYAQANIPEYWLVDSVTEQITVLVLEGAAYRVHGEFGRGQQATSVLLPDFSVDVSATLDAGKA